MLSPLVLSYSCKRYSHHLTLKLYIKLPKSIPPVNHFIRMHNIALFNMVVFCDITRMWIPMSYPSRSLGVNGRSFFVSGTIYEGTSNILLTTIAKYMEKEDWAAYTQTQDILSIQSEYQIENNFSRKYEVKSICIQKCKCMCIAVDPKG